MVNKIPQIWNVNRNNATPLFKQLADNIKWSICLGNVDHGWKLPPVRQMSKELGLSVDTIRAAYKSLEEAGLVITRPQHGTEVVKQPDNGQIFQGLCQGEEDSFAAAIRECFAKNLSAEQVRSLFETVLAREQDNTPEGASCLWNATPRTPPASTPSWLSIWTAASTFCCWIIWRTSPPPTKPAPSATSPS